MRKIILLTILLIIPVTLSSESVFSVHGGFGIVCFSCTGEDGEGEKNSGDRGVNLSLGYDYFFTGNLALHGGAAFDLSTVTYIDGVKISSFPGFVLNAGLSASKGALRLGTGIHYRILNGEEEEKINSVKALLLYINSAVVLATDSPSLILGIEYAWPLTAYAVKYGETGRKLKLRNRFPDTGSLYIYGGIEYSL